MSHLNRYEKREYRKNIVTNTFKGSGVYVFRNNTHADLYLPKPTLKGKRAIAPKEEFEGDSYFLQMVKSHDLLLVKEVTSPNEVKTVEEKIILDQPDTVTVDGTVEHVTKKKDEDVEKKPDKSKDVLLTEDPIDGVDILFS